MSDLRTPSTARPPLGLGRALRRAGASASRMRHARLGRPRLRTVVLTAIVAVLLTAGWFWLRDSSLVAVNDVHVTGLAGGQSAEIERALTEAGRSMTTLHVRRQTLDTAVANFSIVKQIEVSTDFPHGLRVHVVSNVAVGAIELGGRRTPVTADGTLLRDVAAPETLPLVPLHGTPAGSRLKEGEALAAFTALGAAPRALRDRIERVATTRAHGLELKLRDGPALWFGDAERMTAKWAAAAAVLADAATAGATYVDVAAPERPAVGGLPDGAPTVSESDEPELPDGVTIDPETGAAVTPDETTAGAEPETATPDASSESTP